MVKYLYPAVEDKGMVRDSEAVILNDLAVMVDLPVLFYIIGLQFSLIIRCSYTDGDHGAVVGDLADNIKVFNTLTHNRIIARNSYVEIEGCGR